MSNSLAIAAVTATLRDLLNKVAQPLAGDPSPDPDLADVNCTTRSPDRARTGEGQNQLNLFLYRTAPNPSLRNMDLPGQVKPLERAMVPLALDLHYLVTAYGKNFDDLLAHRVLGRAMILMHDRALLLPADIDKALKNNDLGKQTERVRVTLEAMSTEELSKLWGSFQTPYRISVAYQVSLVLIDSNARTRAALPVLARSPFVATGIVPPVPTLSDLQLPFASQPAARLGFAGPPVIAGDIVKFAGHDLTGTQVIASFSLPLLALPNTVIASAATDTGFDVALPSSQIDWPAGIYTVAATVKRATGDRVTNALALPIAPRLTAVAKALVGGVTTLTVQVSPQVWPTQRASLIVGSSEYLSSPHPAKTAALVFPLPGIAPGTYRLRLRIDGVDSFIIKYDVTPPIFDPSPALTVTVP